MMIRYYRGILVYTNNYRDKDGYRMYGEGLMSVIVKEIQTYAMHISDGVKDSKGKSCHAGGVLAKFNPL